MAKKTKTLQGRVMALLIERFSKEVNVVFDGGNPIISKGCKAAINSYDNDKEEVFVTPWFDDFWFFISIQFLQTKNIKKNIRPYVSVSFFQDVGSQLKQLFRAEWDSYSPEENYSHPQPHWHFTAQLSDITSFDELELEEEGIFSELAGNSKTIKLDKMHFAMAGTWLNNGDMIRELADENDLIDWMIYLFRHVREELKYKSC